MRTSKIASFILTVIACVVLRAQAQDTNPPLTDFQNFIQQTNTVIVRGFTVMGSVALGNATLSVNAQEGNDISHGQKKYAVMLVLSDTDQEGRRYVLSQVVDYDELDSLAGAIDYIGKATSDVSQLSGFEASYATKSGFRIISHSDRKQGTVNFYIQFSGYPRVAASSDQLNQIRSLIVQAKSALVSIK
ncbi:MAG TPA: hypothetical protein VK742_19000 [Candidatus Sulfotelmatobacter sp.]|jgi:hypothetical protein|nr:hypothetical protein [Candidatus Sulfotelmatobacter sp.]